MRSIIRDRLRTVFIGLVVVPLLLIGVAVVCGSMYIEKEQAITLRDERARHIVVEIESFVLGFAQKMDMVGRTHNFSGLSSRGQAQVLSGMKAFEDSSFEKLVVLDKSGMETVCVTDTGIADVENLSNRSGRSYFKKPMATGKTYFSTSFIGDDTRRPAMEIAVPLFMPQGRTVDGVLVGTIGLGRIWNLIVQRNESTGENIYIVDADSNEVVAHRNIWTAEKFERFVIPRPRGIGKGLNGNWVVLASKPLVIGDLEYSVVAERPLFEAMEFGSVIIGIVVLLIIIAVLTTVFLEVWVGRQIVQPVESLASAAEAIEGGNLSRRVESSGKGEIARLGRAFNAMTLRLRTSLEELEEDIRLL